MDLAGSAVGRRARLVHCCTMLPLLSTRRTILLKSSRRAHLYVFFCGGSATATGTWNVTCVFLGVVGIFFSLDDYQSRLNINKKKIEKMRLLVILFVLLLAGDFALAQSLTCQQSCTNGYAAFRQWCLSKSTSAKCTSLVNSPRQFTPQACLRFCTE